MSTAEWNRFVAASPYGDVLQCREWGQVKRPAWEPLTVAVMGENGIEATALVLKRRLPRLGKSIFYVPRGPVLDWSNPAAARAISERLRALAARHRAILIKIDPAVPNTVTSVPATLRELGYMPSPDAVGGFGGTQPRCVMKLDLSGTLDDVLARFHQKWRYNIRLAERKGITVRSDCSRDDLAIFHEIYRVTAERDGFTGRPLGYFHKLWDELGPEMLKLFIAYKDEQPLSAALCFLLPPQCWYVYGASSNEHRNLMPNHAMQWAMIRWAKEQGCTLYDFRGVHDVGTTATTNPNEPAPSLIDHPDGLVRFKAGFGADLVEYCGEWDLPLNKPWYWLWTTGRPRLVGALRRLKKGKG